MYSSIYRYLNIHPISKNNYLPTPTIDNAFKSSGIIIEKENGSYINDSSISTFVDIQLLKISNFDSWSIKDFDVQITNYIAIVISRNKSDEKFVISSLIEIARKLQWILFEEDEDEREILFTPE